MGPLEHGREAARPGDRERTPHRQREAPDERILLCVDGVHGFGVEAATPAELGCDVLVSGCQKWLFGPRGTGIVWARKSAWTAITPTIPSFDLREIVAWIEGRKPNLPRALALTPGGFHSFEYRWALPGDVVDRLYDRARIVASVTPYSVRHVRLGPSILNSPGDVDRAVAAIRALT